MEELVNNNLFDQIENILDFQNDDVNDNGEVDFDSFPPVWLDEPTTVTGSAVDSTSRTVRYEDIVQLDWLPNFLQDLPSKPKLLPITHAKRARSKRPRPATFNPRASLNLIPPKTFKQPIKKHKPKPNNNPQGIRKCSHCEITETPQWRMGPNGPKTLCNACGVRYKSGRLFPEYRPAASPTFVPSLHSNSHRKVAEMRKSKYEENFIPPNLFQTSNSPRKVAEMRKSKYEGNSIPHNLFQTSNSPRKVTEMKKSKYEGNSIPPNLFLTSDFPMEGKSVPIELHTNSSLVM